MVWQRDENKGYDSGIRTELKSSVTAVPWRGDGFLLNPATLVASVLRSDDDKTPPERAVAPVPGLSDVFGYLISYASFRQLTSICSFGKLGRSEQPRHSK